MLTIMGVPIQNDQEIVYKVDTAILMVSLAAGETSSTVVGTFEVPFSDKFFIEGHPIQDEL
jgi:hypothetical protein